MIEGRPRESLVQYENPIEVSLYSKYSSMIERLKYLSIQMNNNISIL